MKMLKLMSVLMAAAALAAAGEPEGLGCSITSLKGNYGFLLNGTRPTGPPPAPLEQMIGVALTHFDGLGHATQTDNLHGATTGLSPDRPGTGTYFINPDCSGTMIILNAGAPALEVRFILMDGGKEIRGTVTSPLSVMVAVEGKKL